MRLVFAAMTVSAGTLAGVALLAALLAALSGANRVRVAAILVALAVVLTVTCMLGRSLLAGALGVQPAFADWFILFAAMGAGFGLAGLLVQLDRAGRLPVAPPAWLGLPEENEPLNA